MIDQELVQPTDFGPSQVERTRAIAAVLQLDPTWRSPDKRLPLNGLSLLPDLIGEAKGKGKAGRLFHLSLTGELATPWARRLSCAQSAGYEIWIGVGSTSVGVECLLELQRMDARIVDFDSSGGDLSARGFRSVADWIAYRGLVLAPNDFASLATERLDEALAMMTSVKGRLYEEVLCLMFSQVSWLTVDEHSYNNESEEIDLVLGVHAGGALASLTGGPIAIATAKNLSKSLSSDTVKYLKEQMMNRKGKCKLGFLCSASSISEEAKKEILRGSQSSEMVICELSGEDLKELLERPQDLDHGIESIVRRGVNA